MFSPARSRCEMQCAARLRAQTNPPGPANGTRRCSKRLARRRYGVTTTRTVRFSPPAMSSRAK